MAKKQPGKTAGRPALPDGQARQVIALRLLEKEKEQFERLARAERLTISEWMRKVLNAEVDRKSQLS